MNEILADEVQRIIYGTLNRKLFCLDQACVGAMMQSFIIEYEFAC